MKFVPYYSSSKANLYVVTSADGKRLLIECGCRWEQLLKAVDHKIDNIVGCLMSHAHDDHSHCAEKVMDNCIDVYSESATFESLGLEKHRHSKIVGDRERVDIAPFGVFAFSVPHDVPTLGFTIEADGESILFVTDAMFVPYRFGLQFSTVAICCNYDGELLAKWVESGELNEALAKRLEENHMDYRTTIKYLTEYDKKTKQKICNLDKCTEIYLLHMSGTRIDKENVRSKIERELMIKTLIA